MFTSSSTGEQSEESPEWQNGAFTEILLEALRYADENGDGLIRVSDLSRHLSERVAAITQGRQHPDVEIRFDANVLGRL